jgi:hypothetical protein
LLRRRLRAGGGHRLQLSRLTLLVTQVPKLRSEGEDSAGADSDSPFATLDAFLVVYYLHSAYCGFSPPFPGKSRRESHSMVLIRYSLSILGRSVTTSSRPSCSWAGCPLQLRLVPAVLQCSIKGCNSRLFLCFFLIHTCTLEHSTRVRNDRFLLRLEIQ